MVHRPLPRFPSHLTPPINRLCARWMAAIPAGTSTTFSAAGVWPLLAVLAAGAAHDEAIRARLEEALGASADDAPAMADELIKWFEHAAKSIASPGTAPDRSPLDSAPEGIAAALGLWVTDDIRLKHDSSAVPPGTVHRLSGSAAEDTARLDEWANTHTLGIIPRLPVDIPSGPQIALFVSAMALQTGWRDKFWWDGAMVSRTTKGAGIIRATPRATVVCVRGSNDFDVHLVLGREGATPSEVLPLGLDALKLPTLANDKNDVNGLEAPGLFAAMRQEEEAGYCKAKVHLSVPPFRIQARHDLTAYPGVFGLEPATEGMAISHDYPNITDVPLALQDAVQVATAEFTKDGFSAAAFTTMMARGSALPSMKDVLHITVRFDRPFGFLATHRDSRTVVFAGWVADGF